MIKEVRVELVEEIVTAWDPEREIFYDQSLKPEYARDGDAGFDFRARIYEPLTIQPFQRVLVPTGVKASIPKGCEIQVRPRSGLALKHGISVLNTPGTVDSKYTDEIGVILINLGDKPHTIYPGERIAQGVLKEYIIADIQVVPNIDKTNSRGGGFGHSGSL